jgi:hypothetical protein
MQVGHSKCLKKLRENGCVLVEGNCGGNDTGSAAVHAQNTPKTPRKRKFIDEQGYEGGVPQTPKKSRSSQKKMAQKPKDNEINDNESVDGAQDILKGAQEFLMAAKEEADF